MIYNIIFNKYFQELYLFQNSKAKNSRIYFQCGFINVLLGSKEIYNCPKCFLHIDRDINGSRNILIKMINESM